MGGLPQRQIQVQVGELHVEVRAERLHVLADERGAPVAGQRDGDVGGAENVVGQCREAVADLRPEHRGTHALGHVHQRSGQRVEVGHALGHVLGKAGDAEVLQVDLSHVRHGGQRLLHALSDGFDDLLPRRPGVLEPFAATPHSGGRGAGRKRGGGVEPHLCEVERLADPAHVVVVDRRVALLADRLACEVLGEVPVDRSGHTVLAALQHRAELLQHGAELRHVEAAGVVGIIGVGGEPERKIAAHHIRLFRRGLLGYDDRP